MIKLAMRGARTPRTASRRQPRPTEAGGRTPTFSVGYVECRLDTLLHMLAEFLGGAQ
jgi:hypothetical protein